MSSVPVMHYVRAGNVERWSRRGRLLSIRWLDGYSLVVDDQPCQPWRIRADCRRDAAANGCRARFHASLEAYRLWKKSREVQP